MHPPTPYSYVWIIFVEVLATLPLQRTSELSELLDNMSCCKMLTHNCSNKGSSGSILHDWIRIFTVGQLLSSSVLNLFKLTVWVMRWTEFCFDVNFWLTCQEMIQCNCEERKKWEAVLQICLICGLDSSTAKVDLKCSWAHFS